MDRPLNVETVLEEKFKKLQSEKTEWVNMGSATHQVRIGLEEVVDTDTLVLRFLPEDHPSTRLLDLGLLLLLIVNETYWHLFKALALANFLSISMAT